MKTRPFRRIRLSHFKFKRQGGYGFLQANLIRFVGALLLFALAVIALFSFLVDRSALELWIDTHLSPFWLLGTLFISEAITGILPPDLYILAVGSYANPWFWVFLLALASYLGGICAYFIGTRLGDLPRIHRWITGSYAEQFSQIRKYGGLLVVLAALTPLPYSPVSTVAGAVDFPFKLYLLYGLSRFARFFLYAWVIYSV